MDDKTALASCTGMSALGLISRAAVSDLVEDYENLISICITSTSTDKPSSVSLINRFPIIAVNGCNHGCVNKILESKGAAVKSDIDVSKHVTDHNPKNISRLGDNEKFVDEIKKEIMDLL